MRRLDGQILAIALFAVIGVYSGCQTAAVESVASSHVEANAPASDQFQKLMVRDLKFYLDARTGLDLKIEYDLLRDGPTQTGISYPKYYVWVRGLDEDRVIIDGAARVAAIDRSRFEITHFLPRQKIRGSSADVEKIFPAGLKPVILKKANAQ